MRREPLDPMASVQVELSGYEGPLDVLLDLARAQKVDLAKLSMVALADQFLAYVEDAKDRRLDVAADFLLMAAWLAWLKSRLLIPKQERPTEEPDAETQAARLAQRLMNLASARARAEQLDRCVRLCRDVFLNGAPTPIVRSDAVQFSATLGEMFAAYGAGRGRQVRARHAVAQRVVYPIAAARQHLAARAVAMADWTGLAVLAAEANAPAAPPASKVASTLGAALELIRDGVLDARQDQAFAEVLLRARPTPAENPGGVDG
jgi:segregation and condensation protein A